MATQMKELRYPFDERQVRALKAGDAVEISGMVHTGRDKFHKFFADGGKIPVDFRDGALYHCGPVCVKAGDGWRVVSAGPTTSVRENPYEPAFIASSGVRVIIGKGGMDAATLAAMKRHGCVYVQAVGGAGALYAASVVCSIIAFQLYQCGIEGRRRGRGGLARTHRRACCNPLNGKYGIIYKF